MNNFKYVHELLLDEEINAREKHFSDDSCKNASVALFHCSLKLVQGGKKTVNRRRAKQTILDNLSGAVWIANNIEVINWVNLDLFGRQNNVGAIVPYTNQYISLIAGNFLHLGKHISLMWLKSKLLLA